MKFKKGDIVAAKDKSYLKYINQDTIIVTRTYCDDNDDEKFDGYSKHDGRTYSAMPVDRYRVESADEKDEVESGEDNLCYVDRLWSNLRKICSDLPYEDMKRLFGNRIIFTD